MADSETGFPVEGAAIALLVLVLFCGLSYIAGNVTAENAGEEAAYREAVKAGAARWSADPQTGEPVIEWIVADKEKTDG